jgi:hypothetical protein
MAALNVRALLKDTTRSKYDHSGRQTESPNCVSIQRRGLGPDKDRGWIGESARKKRRWLHALNDHVEIRTLDGAEVDARWVHGHADLPKGVALGIGETESDLNLADQT